MGTAYTFWSKRSVGYRNKYICRLSMEFSNIPLLNENLHNLCTLLDWYWLRYLFLPFVVLFLSSNQQILCCRTFLCWNMSSEDEPSLAACTFFHPFDFSTSMHYWKSRSLILPTILEPLWFLWTQVWLSRPPSLIFDPQFPWSWILLTFLKSSNLSGWIWIKNFRFIYAAFWYFWFE